MANRGGEFSIFQGIRVRFDIRIGISISIRPIYPDLASRYI